MSNSVALEELNKSCFSYVLALAGTGKTTLLCDYAKKHPDERILYIALNESIVSDAKSRFPNNVVCKTVHSLAYQFVGFKYKRKLMPYIPIATIIETLFINKSPYRFKIAKAILDKIQRFTYSEYLNINDVFSAFSDDYSNINMSLSQMQKYVSIIWGKMIDKNNKFPITHDTYLKLYQLKNNQISTMDYLPFDTILVDEFQDINSAIKVIVLNQYNIAGKKIVAVGDRNQYIYGFRGSINMFDYLDGLNDVNRVYLNKTYRFGEDIAMAANAVLHIKGETSNFVIGNELVKSNIVNKIENNYTLICRTNAGLMANAIRLTGQNKKIFFLTKNVTNFNLLIDLYHLKYDRKKVLNKDIKKFSSFKILEDYYKNINDAEMLLLINVVNNYKKDLINKIKITKSFIVDNIKNADIILTTVHSSKGLEFDNVVLANDFYNPFDKKKELKIDQNIEELNIIYTAITRAKYNIKLNNVSCDIIKYVSYNNG